MSQSTNHQAQIDRVVARTMLTVAAPDLLEACKAVLPLLQDHVNFSEDNEAETAALNKIKAAIDKAQPGSAAFVPAGYSMPSSTRPGKSANKQ